MEQVNILMGRFQPITLGHIKCAEEMWRKKGLKTLLLVVNTTKEDEKHPFTTSLLIPYYEKLGKEFDYIAGYVIVKNADIVINIGVCRDAGFEPVTWSCGSDRYASYKMMVDKYGEKAGLSPDFEVVEIKRGDEDISATRVRNALLKNDRKTFEKLTPKTIHPAYDILKTNVERYCSIKEHAKGLYGFIMERMGEMSINKMFTQYPSYISSHIIKHGPRINKIMDAVEDCYNDTCITGNKIYWFFDDVDQCEDVWIKMQRILGKKSLKNLTGEQVITDDDIELTMTIK